MVNDIDARRVRLLSSRLGSVHYNAIGLTYRLYHSTAKGGRGGRMWRWPRLHLQRNGIEGHPFHQRTTRWIMFSSKHTLSRTITLQHFGRVPVYLELRDRPRFSSLKYDSAIMAPLSAIQLPVNKITDLYLPTP